MITDFSTVAQSSSTNGYLIISCHWVNFVIHDAKN
jgi:hypothetical protein